MKQGDKMKTESFILITLSIMLLYGVYTYLRSQKARSRTANSVVETLNAKMSALGTASETRHLRYVERHIQLEKMIQQNTEASNENEKSIGTVGRQLLEVIRSVDKNQVEVKDLLKSIEDGINVHVKSLPKKKPRKRRRKKKPSRGLEL